jgi:hypothetical protein
MANDETVGAESFKAKKLAISQMHSKATKED